MINCNQATNLFDAYLDGELGGGLNAELHAHVMSCDECRLDLAIHRACGDVVAHDGARPGLSAAFTDRVIAQWQRPQRRAARSTWRVMRLWGGPSLAAAAVLALCVLPLRSMQMSNTLTASELIDVRSGIVVNGPKIETVHADVVPGAAAMSRVVPVGEGEESDPAAVIAPHADAAAVLELGELVGR